MIYRKRTYKINADKYESFNNYFHSYLLPNQMKNGAKLAGRWTNIEKNKVEAMWEYKDMDDYYAIQQKVKDDPLFQLAQKNKHSIDQVILEKKEEFLHSTGDYFDSKYSLAACGWIENKQGEVLLVKTEWRSDTYEMPGGIVEEGESIDEACKRKIKEETGVEVTLSGITGVYTNETKRHIVFVFAGQYLDGQLSTQSNEIQDCGFFTISKNNMCQYVTRGNFQSRMLDAMSSSSIPLEHFTVRPYTVISRVE
ncbi:NUDIX hydrolase [Gracilibacillus timonensis]|uniref:NUDIX hydrolase n=1 Tax=Gracilibacillus timonensis TaxID=1816696 RepID=UPI00098F4415|nr:NUDIX hydrolase [Gracilibacillus timonensis]